MMSVYHASYNPHRDYTEGYQVPKLGIKDTPMLWIWNGIPTNLKNMSFGQLKTEKKICQEKKGIWFRYTWDSWIEEIDKILYKENVKSLNIKVIGFLQILINNQNDYTRKNRILTSLKNI